MGRLIYADRVKETTTAGTGTITLDGTTIGYQSFIGGYCCYCIVSDSNHWLPMLNGA